MPERSREDYIREIDSKEKFSWDNYVYCNVFITESEMCILADWCNNQDRSEQLTRATVDKTMSSMGIIMHDTPQRFVY